MALMWVLISTVNVQPKDVLQGYPDASFMAYEDGRILFVGRKSRAHLMTIEEVPDYQNVIMDEAGTPTKPILADYFNIPY